jgi:DNA-binding NarL/FixJ family response regulator
VIAPTRALLVDDELSFRDETATIMRRAGYMCDCADDPTEAIATLADRSYDVVLAEIKMSGRTSLDVVDQAARRCPAVPVIIVTKEPSLTTAVQAIRLSVFDYVVKPVPPETLLPTVASAVQLGRRRFKLMQIGEQLDALARQIRAEAQPAGATVADESIARSADLSPREREIAEGIANGSSVAALATTHHISERTVRNHLQSCYRKLGVHSQVTLAVRLRLHRR